MAKQPDNHGPDLSLGVTIADLPEGRLLKGHVGDDDVVLVQSRKTFFAVGATCTHYGGPLAEGVIDGFTLRCPWHHACFDVRTGESVRAPAFDALPCWSTETRDGKVFVTAKCDDHESARLPSHKSARRHAVVTPAPPGRIVIVGGGAAGFAAAEMLRRLEFKGSLVMLSEDAALPVDRPNLSKDYLAGSAQEDWVPLKPESWYEAHQIILRRGVHVTRVDVRAHEVSIASGERIRYERLLLATGAEPVGLDVPGKNQRHVHVLRSLHDSNAVIAAARSARRAVVVGASFIGLEVAASLRAHKLEVHVVAPEERPLERIFGREIGDFVRALHEEHGVVFHLPDTIASIASTSVMLKSGKSLDADLVVVGIGVRPRLAVAERAGLTMDRGVSVNPHLETSASDVFAAGDIARWPDPHTGQNIRVEHWVVAERQGQTAARNMLGAKEPFVEVPFFWSQHYDVAINYVGHAEGWDAMDIDGDPRSRDCTVRYLKDGRFVAMASIGRDVDSLKAELELERRREQRERGD